VTKFNLRDELRKKAQSRLPKEVWVDRDGKIVYVKGVKTNEDRNRVSYNQFRELGRAGGLNPDTPLKFYVNGIKFHGPLRKLSDEEVQSRLSEILGI